MEQYLFSPQTGSIARCESRNADFSAGGVFLYETGEAQNLPASLSRRAAFLFSLQHIRYCKAESFGGCVIGTLYIPSELTEETEPVKIAFHLENNTLILVGNIQTLRTNVAEVTETPSDGLCAAILLLHMIESFLSDDVLYLQSIDEEFTHKEEALLHTIPTDFNGYLMTSRRKLSRLHAYYEQLADVADVLEGSLAMVNENQSNAWRLLGERCGRLHNNTEALSEYLQQLRELYRSQIDLRQSRTMSLLTVVTTLFLPLSLVAAWYGMNFSNMLAINSRWGYPVVLLLVVLLVVGEIIYFKKKKMF